MTLRPNTFRRRAVMSGILTRVGFRGLAGSKRATILRRRVMATSSPSATHSNIRLNPRRTSLIDAVLICHKKHHP